MKPPVDNQLLRQPNGQEAHPTSENSHIAKDSLSDSNLDSNHKNVLENPEKMADIESTANRLEEHKQNEHAPDNVSIVTPIGLVLDKTVSINFGGFGIEGEKRL